MLAAYPSLFAKFSLFYYGFFGLTLAINPSIHALDGPVPNPMAYWTTLSTDAIIPFRLCGISFLTIILGPTFGVSMSAFYQQMVFANFAVMLLFLYYGLFAVPQTAVAFMWQGQAFLAAAIFAWSVLEQAAPLVSSSLKANYLKFITIYFCFFGVSLVAAPETFFGSASPSGMVYWTEWGDLTTMCARSLGATIVAVIGLGYVYIIADAFLNIVNFFNIINIPMFALPAFYSAGAANAAMWQVQLAIQVPIVIIGINLALPRLDFAFKMPSSCGLNTETFAFANLCFFAPFVVGFLTAPNLIFGPSSPSGMPMFTEDLNETGLWFAKSWAIGIGLCVLGPYVFKVPAATTAKELLFAYSFTCALFVYAILNYSVFNLTVVVPMTVLNFLFLFWNIKVVYENDKNGDKLFMYLPL